jgi:hypothetical protein
MFIRGAVMIGRQRIPVGLPHAGKTTTITVGSDTHQIQIEHDDIAISAPQHQP